MVERPRRCPAPAPGRRAGSRHPARRALCSFVAAAAILCLDSRPATGADGHAGWAARADQATHDISDGRPLVTVVIVPLCHREQIACGTAGLGAPGNVETNLYWGALYGAKRFFDRSDSGFAPLPQPPGPSDELWLDRAVYRRWADGSHWGLPEGRRVEQIVVLEAVHGARIDAAVDRFWSLATRGGSVRFVDGAREREERIHAVGYAGHNRLMDGKRLPASPPPAEAQPIPSFVLACLSHRFFAAQLQAAGSRPLLTTRAYIAPEGYVVRAAVRALGDNASPLRLRRDVVAAYAKWHSLSASTASRLFAPAPAN